MSLYEQDYCAWVTQHINLLKLKQLTQMDIKNLIEELDDMGAHQHHALLNRLRILLAHLLKWQYQARYRSRSWNATIFEQRVQIEELLERSPSLQSTLLAKIEKSYPKALKLAAKETGIHVSVFPSDCPYSHQEILDENFYP